MLFGSVSNIDPCMLPVGKNLGRRRRDVVEQAGFHKHLFWCHRSFGIYRARNMSAILYIVPIVPYLPQRAQK